MGGGGRYGVGGDARGRGGYGMMSYRTGGQGREMGFGRGCMGDYGVGGGWVLDSEQGRGCEFVGDGTGTTQMVWDAY